MLARGRLEPGRRVANQRRDQSSCSVLYRVATALAFLLDGSPVRDELWAKPFRLQLLNYFARNSDKRLWGVILVAQPLAFTNSLQHHAVPSPGNRTSVVSGDVPGFSENPTRQ